MGSIIDPSTIEENAPAWSDWTPSPLYSVGFEEEIMLLRPDGPALEQDTEAVFARLPLSLREHAAAETHAAALELATSPHATATEAGREAFELRAALDSHLATLGVRAACAGTHPSALWSEIRISSGARYQFVYDTMRELAHREPTFALHVHVGVSDPERAITLFNRLRLHVPLLLAVSANSPFWQGRDTGLDSARTPIFQGFPRVGIPRAFQSYREYVAVIDQLLRCGAFPDPTFLWWDVRLQPKLGTVEVRVMDAQTTVDRTTALAALVQAIGRLELEEGYHDLGALTAPEILDENRFLAARDGMAAQFIDPLASSRVTAADALGRLLDAALPHAADLGCSDAVAAVAEIAREPGCARQRQIESRVGMGGLVDVLAGQFLA